MTEATMNGANADRDFLLEMLFLAGALLLVERVIWECPFTVMVLVYALPVAALLALGAYLFLTGGRE